MWSQMRPQTIGSKALGFFMFNVFFSCTDKYTSKTYRKKWQNYSYEATIKINIWLGVPKTVRNL